MHTESAPNAQLWIRGRVPGGSQMLLGVLPEDAFQPVRLTTPPGAVRVMLRGLAQPFGAELDLVDLFPTLAPGEVLALHVVNESEDAHHVAIRVDGLAVSIAGDLSGPELEQGELPRAPLYAVTPIVCRRCGLEPSCSCGVGEALIELGARA